MFELFDELDVFNNIVYHDEPHVYYINGKQATSVTTLIGKFQEDFNEEYWSKKESIKTGETVQQVIDRWKLKADIAGNKGTIVHNYIENRLSNKVFPYPSDDIIKFFGYDPVKEKVDKIIPLAEKFIADIKSKLIPIKSELVIGDIEYNICGMIDQVFYNKKSGMLELWDWKTNQKIDSKNSYKMLKPLNHLSTSKLDIYSLQLSLYKHIIEKNTKLRFGNSYLNWFNEENDTYIIFKCNDYEKEVLMMIDAFSKSKLL